METTEGVTMSVSDHHALPPDATHEIARDLADQIFQAVRHDEQFRSHLTEIARLGGLESLHATARQASAQMLVSLQLNRSLASLSGTVTPAAAARAAATESLWRQIEHEHGLLTADEVRQLAGAKGKTYASDKRHSGHLLGVKRLNRILYPGFQFDGEAPRPVMGQLHRAAAQYEVPEEAVLLWMASPTTWWGEDTRPVDHLEDTDGILGAFRSRFGTEW